MKLNNFKSWLIEKNLNNLDYLKRLSIIDNESLTKRLESETQNNFKVNVISQKTVHNLFYLTQ